ncbi:YopX family protein [Bacteroides neonati]|uniref:YopX family protein n=1 Tax=Bacteroides neonati TaxID=1347393 RepID=UPI0004B5003B|nr:YopX family protein [Bacteroides neonati]
MKRQIKFRGKRVDTGEWIFGYYLEFSLCDGEGRCSYIKVDGCQPIKVVPDTVGQFTGLLDKNGKEIYEGDLLKRMCFNPKSTNGEKIQFISQVYFSSNTNPSGWRVKNSTKTGGWSKGLSFNMIYNNEAIVIGNIHDNPELLKGGKE